MDHHLVPKEFGGTETIASCRDCHKAIHTLFTNRELVNHYHTRERLLANEKFVQMIAYIRKQDPAGKVKFKRTRERRKR